MTDVSGTIRIRYMNTQRTFEIHMLEGRYFVRPYVGNDEYTGETFNTLTEARAALPAMASDLGWPNDYNVTEAFT